MTGRARTVGLLVVIVAALGACGGDDDEADGTDAAPGSTAAGSDETATAATTDAATASDAPATDAPATSDDPAATDAPATAPATGGGDEQDYVDAIAADFVDLDDDELGVCISQAIVDAIGFDRIQASGLSPEEFADLDSFPDADLAPEAASLATMQSDLDDCGDLVEAIAAAAGDDDETQIQCVRDTFTNELMAELLVSQISGRAPSDELLAARDEARECAGEE